MVRTNQKAFALVAVLWVVILAALMLLNVQQAARLNLAASQNQLAAVQAHWVARAGIDQAIAVLQDDLSGADSFTDFWYEDSTSFYEVRLGNGQFSVSAPNDPDNANQGARYGLLDQGSRLNLNIADAKQLQKITELNDLQIEALLDWRDEDEEVRTGGAEAGHYDRLEIPYQIRNGPMLTPREPLLVRGIDLQTYYGEDVNLNGALDAHEDDGVATWPPDDANGRLKFGLGGLCTVYSYELNHDQNGNQRVDLNNVTQNTLQERFKFSEPLAKAVIDHRGRRRLQNVMELLDVNQGQPQGEQAGEKKEEQVEQIDVKWLAQNLGELTVTDESKLYGRINVNTAPRQVLMTLPEMTADAVDEIIKQRESRLGGFSSVGKLFLEKTINERQFKAVAEMLTVKSNVFQVVSVGKTQSGIARRIVAMVDRGASSAKIIYWYQGQ